MTFFYGFIFGVIFLFVFRALFLHFTKSAAKVVEEKWLEYLEGGTGDFFRRKATDPNNRLYKVYSEFIKVISIAAQESQLRRLYPFNGHFNFFFSGCTKYPYTDDLPYIEVCMDGSCNVYNRSKSIYSDGQILAKGCDAFEAVQFIIKHIPPDYGPVVLGTAKKHARLKKLSD